MNPDYILLGLALLALLVILDKLALLVPKYLMESRAYRGLDICLHCVIMVLSNEKGNYIMYAIVIKKSGKIGLVVGTASALKIAKRIYRRNKIAIKTVKIED